MKWITRENLTFALLAAVLFLGVQQWLAIRSLNMGVARVIEQNERLRAMIAETITNSDGDRTVTITTTTGDTGNADEDWATVQARHDSRVADWLAGH